MSSGVNKDIQQLSPDKLMKGFSQTPFIKGILLAVIIHIVFVSLTSLQFIWRTWIAAEEPEAPAVEASADGEADVESTPTDETSAGTAVVTGTVEKIENEQRGAQSEADEARSEHDQMMEKYRDTPTVREITEAADESEIPDAPDDLGISIEDTNPF